MLIFMSILEHIFPPNLFALFCIIFSGTVGETIAGDRSNRSRLFTQS